MSDDAPAQEPIPIFVLQEMLGETLTTALINARGRLGDPGMMVRIDEGTYMIERDGVAIITGLSHDDTVARLDQMAL